MTRRTDTILASKFVCPHYQHQGGSVERLAMSGTGVSRLMEIQHHRFAFVSCTNCGYTEVFNLKVLEGRDDLGTFLEFLFRN